MKISKILLIKVFLIMVGILRVNEAKASVIDNTPLTEDLELNLDISKSNNMIKLAGCPFDDDYNVNFNQMNNSINHIKFS